MTISQPKSNEKEISLCVKAAIKKLEKIEADANKKKTQIVQDLAKDLESLQIPIDRICNEIVHQLRGKVSERLIRDCLHEKYKEKHRVANARKQKRKHQNTEDLAASVPLEQEKPQQQIAVTQEGKSVIMNDTSTDTGAYPISSDGFNEPHDRSKQNEIGTNANNEESIQDTDTKEELAVTHSLNDEITPINKQSEDIADRKKGMFVSHVPISFEDLRKDMDAVSQTTNGAANIFFEVLVDLGACEVKIEFCGRRKKKNRSMTSMGKGVLKEAN